MEKLSKNNGSAHPHFTGCDVIWISFVICAALGAIITYSTDDTLALATGTRVGASDHAITLFVLNMVVSLGFCTLIHYIYINSVV